MSYLNRLVKTMIRWAVTSKVVQESGAFPLQQVSYLGKVGDSVVWLPYGYHASPPAGALVLLVASQGNAESRAHIPGSPKERPTDLAPTEVALYHPPTGTRIVLRANGDLEINAVGNLAATIGGSASVEAVGPVTIESAASVDVTAAADVGITAAGDVVVNAGGVVHLGGLGGSPVARVGDAITITPPEVAAGSAKVFAVD